VALYKYAECVRQVESPAFDAILPPGTPAPWAGIYQCDFCGCEIAVARNYILPPRNHHEHKSKAKIHWRLTVSLREDGGEHDPRPSCRSDHEAP